MDDDQQKAEAAIAFQKSWQRKEAQKEDNKLRANKERSDEIITKLQAAVRGHLARRKIEEELKKLDWVVVDDNDDMEVRVQAWWHPKLLQLYNDRLDRFNSTRSRKDRPGSRSGVGRGADKSRHSPRSESPAAREKSRRSPRSASSIESPKAQRKAGRITPAARSARTERASPKSARPKHVQKNRDARRCVYAYAGDTN